MFEDEYSGTQLRPPRFYGQNKSFVSHFSEPLNMATPLIRPDICGRLNPCLQTAAYFFYGQFTHVV